MGSTWRWAIRKAKAPTAITLPAKTMAAGTSLQTSPKPIDSGYTPERIGIEVISRQWAVRAPTLENTGLGGGIGFHGWIKEWDNDGPRHMSFGCVVMHLYDISKLYEEIDAGAMVVIF